MNFKEITKIDIISDLSVNYSLEYNNDHFCSFIDESNRDF
jgi:hypothetical protein